MAFGIQFAHKQTKLQKPEGSAGINSSQLTEVVQEVFTNKDTEKQKPGEDGEVGSGKDQINIQTVPKPSKQ